MSGPTSVFARLKGFPVSPKDHDVGTVRILKRAAEK
jgi:hypothetical protein